MSLRILLILSSLTSCSISLVSSAEAQIQIGTVRGRVVDTTGAVVPGALVSLHNTVTGFHRQTTTNHLGDFTFNNVPFAPHRLRVHASGLLVFETMIRLLSNFPLLLDVELQVKGSEEQVTVEADLLLERDSLSTETALPSQVLELWPGVHPGTGLQKMIATVPGWAIENNGILHSRGVDNGFLFVSDGIPLIDRIDTLFAGPIDAAIIESIRVINGHIPAEYGYASGGVINIVPKSGIDKPLGASLTFGAGNFRTGEASYSVRGNVKRKLGFFFANSVTGSLQRYLDPVDPRNFNNRGGALRLSLRTDWHATSKDIFLMNFSTNGSDFRVPNTFEQELQSQRQQQQLRDKHGAVTWQHVWSPATVTNVGLYRRSYRAQLIPSSDDTPLSTRQSRKHVRQGALINLTHNHKGHRLQLGVDAQRVTPDELFSFFVTDLDKALEADLTPLVLQFDENSPFLFEDRVVRGQASWYVQDTFPLLENLTINLGLRFDHTALLVSASQFSPRAAAVYYVPQTRTAIRGSYNRLFMPPQIENLLLSSSEEARQLSPFITSEGEGGAEVSPETQHAFEVGLAQDFSSLIKMDIAYWWRFVRNYNDPNVFLGTTVIFPNSVARGEAQGLDVRIDLPETKGWSTYLSYSNSRVFQIGPVNGGLFLEKAVIEIGPGMRFTPDHDQRNVGGFGSAYHHRKLGLSVSFSGRHESGTPLEVEGDGLEELKERPGAELVDFDRQRVRPRTLFDLSIKQKIFSGEQVTASLQVDILNLTNRQFAFNFGNPFSGTHFGYPQLWSVRIKFDLH